MGTQQFKRAEDLMDRTAKIEASRAVHREISSIRHWSVFHWLFSSLIELGHIIESRVLVWRGFFLVSELAVLLVAATYLYCRIHGYDLSTLFGTSKFALPPTTFVPGDGFVPTAIEVAYWSSVAVIVKRLRASAVDARRPDFDLVCYFTDVFAEWISVPVMATFVVFFLRSFKVDLGQGIELSIATADVGMIVALSFILGMFSEDIMPLLKRFRMRMRLRGRDIENR